MSCKARLGSRPLRHAGVDRGSGLECPPESWRIFQHASALEFHGPRHELPWACHPLLLTSVHRCSKKLERKRDSKSLREYGHACHVTISSGVTIRVIHVHDQTAPAGGGG